MSVVGRQRLPIIPYLGHSSRALSFYEMNDIFLAIGRTSAWDVNETDNDFIPPEPDMEATGIDELIGMKKVTEKFLVIPDNENGTIKWNDKKYRILSVAEAKEEQSRWVYLKTEIQYDELDETDYRQVAIFSRTQRKDGVLDTKEILLPDEIEDVGYLELLDNRHVVTRMEDTKEVYSIVIEF